MLSFLLNPDRVNGSAPPLFHQSRCLRRRFRDTRCSLCLEACPRKALDPAAAPAVNPASCSSCYQCTAVCPTAALVVPRFDLRRYLHEIAARQPLLIGCPLSLARPRAAIPCLGLLSKLHLSLLSLHGSQIELDLQPCSRCAKGRVAEEVKNRLEDLWEILAARPGPAMTLRGQEEPSSPSRRDFFMALRTEFCQELAGLRQSGEQQPPPFAAKVLPEARQLLNEALRNARSDQKYQLAEDFYFHLEVTSGCDFCLACVAACPTGALRKKPENGGSALRFQSATCSGCGLCIEFCHRQALRIKSARSDTDLFGWQDLCFMP